MIGSDYYAELWDVGYEVSVVVGEMGITLVNCPTLKLEECILHTSWDALLQLPVQVTTTGWGRGEVEGSVFALRLPGERRPTDLE